MELAAEVEYDDIDEGEEEENEEEVKGVGRGNCKPFDTKIVTQLKILWAEGMVGIGAKKYGNLIRLAVTRTGLTQNQVKVCLVISQIFHRIPYNASPATVNCVAGYLAMYPSRWSQIKASDQDTIFHPDL